MSKVIKKSVKTGKNKIPPNLSTPFDTINSENEILRKLFSEMPGNVYWKDLDGKYLGCNKNVALIFGYSLPEEIIGKRNKELFSPQLAKEIDASDQEIYQTGIGKTVEEPGINAGQPAIYMSKKIPLFNSDGKMMGLLGVSFDITARKQMEEALKIAKYQAEEANRSKTEFITNLSHDVKTPLAGIIGLAELLTYRLNSEELDFSQILLASSRQLLSFFDNCLEVFKLENSNAALTIEKFDFKDVINEINEVYSSTLKSRKLNLVIDYSISVPDNIIGSRTGVYRILLNLVGNAIKFTPHGNIYIKVQTKDDKLQLIVEDSGIGIPKDKQEAIFAQFTRLIPSYKGTYDGSGIGLYIVHKFVTSMAGSIDVISEPEKGSRFTVTLPLLNQEYTSTRAHTPTRPTNNTPVVSSQIPISPISQSITAASAAINILLVEDNLIVQRIQTSLLNTFNCYVNIAETGEQALEMFEANKYDLVFMDIGLPDMQGTLAAKLMRKLERGTGSCVPIIALTAHISETTPFSDSGINDIMQKPLSREQAKEIIDKYGLQTKGGGKMKSPHLDSVKKMLII